MSHPSGQASLEWIAILAVVAVLLTAGSALAEGPAVGRRVTRAMARAVCVVGGGDCARDREPCVVSSARERRDRHAELLILRLGHEQTVLVEERSDGTVAVTSTKGTRTGYELQPGVGARFAGGPVAFEVGGQFGAASLATSRGGRTWTLPSRAAADALVARLRRGDDLPQADVVYDEDEEDERGGISVTGGAQVGDLSADLGHATGELGFGRRSGVRWDRRTGHRTLYLTSGGHAEASAQAFGGVLGVSRSSAPGGEVYALEIDERGEPVDLAITAVGAYRGSADLPELAMPVAGMLSRPARGARLYEVEAHLDLNDDGNLAAVRALVQRLRVPEVRFGEVVSASQALRRRIAERGTVEARVLDAATQSSARAFSGKAGVQLGAGEEREHRTVDLLAAQSRGLDGQWIAREDCVA